ncbi:VirB6-like protein of the type IV secretion system [Candidatus Phycorickettsia trachydisci]|uniref:VirB6-like protein of the type IV secretion system n=1 Tax=Candidatus Phycorickettsia trachydisci TaxID=2115978 RepID=A0A2P1P8S4_9RICK|nr:type IV secretion system protein [Candidatus Phycorickettsia trachydisci]AVP87661.1 VirB6-like protein of the type IV secretion system [Candidatus Phycorickettsia trachydisci]
MSGDGQKKEDNKQPPKPPSKNQMRMAQMMMRIMFQVVRVLIIVSVFLSILAGFGLAPFLGCYLKYPSQTGTLTTTATVTLYGNGMSALNPIDYNATTSNISYGQWTKVNLAIKGGGSLYFQAQGSVSLCKSYYPDTWTQEIPRVGDTTWFNLDLNAANSTYTLTEVFNGDLVKVKIGDNAHTNGYGYSSLYNPITKQLLVNPSANCSDGQAAYDSMCGKYSYYYNLTRTAPTGCTVANNVLRKDSYSGTNGCSGGDVDNQVWYQNNGYSCPQVKTWVCETGPFGVDECRCFYFDCYRFDNSIVNLVYSSSNVYLSTDSITIANSPTDMVWNGTNYVCPSISDAAAMWFTFDKIGTTKTQGGLKYSITNTSISNQTVNIIDNCGTTNPSGCHNFTDRYIFDNSTSGGVTNLTQTSGNLTYSFLANPAYTDYLGVTRYGGYTGGYVLSLQHTKCYRTNGAYSSDKVYANRGAVKYLILDDGVDPNAYTAMSASGIGNSINFINGDSSAQTITSDQDGVLWLRIDNKSSDYTSSNGSYSITVSQGTPVAVAQGFDLWPEIYGFFNNAFGNLTTKLFQNLTCYGAADKSSCFNLFQVIRALLVAYIMIFAIFFLIGLIQVDYYDFIQRIIKITIVGGLISGKTFDFFNNYIFNIIFGFTNSLMNSAVFFPTTDGSSGLGAFLKAIFSTLGQDIFHIQLLAMLGTGFTGIIMIILIIISFVLFLIPILNLMAVTLVSYFFVSVLLGMAPIFLIFTLFRPTQHIFKQWTAYIIAYLFEPVMLFIGIAILAKLFIIYLDYVLGYSVCFKCNAVFSIPFIGDIPGLGLLKVVTEQMPLFCIYWLSPWGYDTMSFNYGQALTDVIALFSIASATYYYTSMCNQLVNQIFGVSTVGGQLADSMTKQGMQKAAQGAQQVRQMMSSRGGAGGPGGGSGGAGGPGGK